MNGLSGWHTTSCTAITGVTGAGAGAGLTGSVAAGLAGAEPMVFPAGSVTACEGFGAFGRFRNSCAVMV